MSDYIFSQVKDDLSGIAHGKTVNKFTNVYSIARRASNNLLSTIDPDETRVIGQVTLYDQVYDYPSFSDLKGKGIIDIRPQKSPSKQRSDADNLSSRMSKDFDMRKKWGSWFTVMNNGGLQYFRIKAQINPAATTLDSLDIVGGWAATAAAQNLSLDDIIYDQGALQFDIAAGANPTAGYIQSSTISAVDLTDYVNKSAAFFELYIPTAAVLAAIVSINLRWGNDNTTNYMSRTVTTPHIGAFKVGRNLIRMDWNGATKAGTIIATTIDSARITINTNGTAISALIVSNIFFAIGKVWDVEYYSKNLYTLNGVTTDKVTDDTTTINLDTDGYNIYLYEFALAGLQQIQGKDAMADRQYFQDQLHGNDSKDIEGLYNLYKTRNPSQREKVTQQYYNNFGFRNRNSGRRR